MKIKRFDWLGITVIIMAALYLILKLQRLPGPHGIMIIGGMILAIYLPLNFLENYRRTNSRSLKLVHKFGGLLLGFFILSVVLRFQYWALVMFENKEVVTYLTINPWFFEWVYPVFSIIFIPWLIITINSESRGEGLLKNIIGGAGLSLISMGLLLNQWRFYFWAEMLTIGNILFILIFIPLHVKYLRSKSRETGNFLITIIVSYLFIIFIYFIFWREPVTFQDVAREIQSNK